MDRLNYLKIVNFVFVIIFVSNNGICQTDDCYELCYYERDVNYCSKNQEQDFAYLSRLNFTNDSIKVLKRIIGFDCNSKLGKKSKTILNEIISEKIKSFYGEWNFEWLGSNWGTGEIDSLKTEKILKIHKDKIEFIQNRKTENNASKILCVGLNFNEELYFLIKIDSVIWEFYLDENLNRNMYARIDTPDKLKKKNQFIFLREYGGVCGNLEMYYSKIEN